MAVIRSQCKNDEEYLQALRDDFAAAAMSRMLPWNFDYPDMATAITTKLCKMISETSFKVADAMLAEREKNNVDK